jgi:hypothetical protein
VAVNVGRELPLVVFLHDVSVDPGSHFGIALGDLGPHLGIQEVGHRDRGQDAYDRYDDEQLNQSEASP